MTLMNQMNASPSENLITILHKEYDTQPNKNTMKSNRSNSDVTQNVLPSFLIFHLSSIRQKLRMPSSTNVRSEKG